MKRWWWRSLALSIVLAGGMAVAGEVDDRIRELGSDDFRKREAATAWLGDQGPDALPLLEQAAKDKDPEVRWRAEKALQAIRARGGRAAPKPQPPQAQPLPPKPVPPKPQAPEPPTNEPLVPMPDLDQALEKARQRLKGVQEELNRVRPGLRDFMEGLGGNDLDLNKIFEDMDRRFRELDRPDAPGGGVLRDFWSFRYKDGKWELVRPEDPIQSRLGLRTQATPPVLKAQLKLDGEPDGAVIEEVIPKGAAAEAGLQQWDLVLTIDARPVANEKDLQLLLAEGPHKVGIVRGGQKMELALTPRPATVGERPPAGPPPSGLKKDGGTVAPPPTPEAPVPPAPPKKDELRKY